MILINNNKLKDLSFLINKLYNRQVYKINSRIHKIYNKIQKIQIKQHLIEQINKNSVKKYQTFQTQIDETIK